MPAPLPQTPEERARQLSFLQNLLSGEPGIARKFIHGLVDIPHQAYETGQVPEAGRDTLLYSANMLSGGAFAAPKAGLGIFGGRLAKTADLTALEKAQGLEAAGAPREQIWNDTGWFRGEDKKWRFEINDRPALPPQEMGMKAPGQRKGQKLRPSYEAGRITPEGTRKQFLLHPELYKAYPDMGSAHMGWAPPQMQMSPGEAAYYPPRDFTYLGPAAEEGTKKSILHEFQHAVQKREGFSGGTSTESAVGEILKSLNEQRLAGKLSQADFVSIADPLLKQQQVAKDWLNRPKEAAEARSMIYDAYRRNVGETEARNVANRSSMDVEQRRAMPPWTTQDVPSEKQWSGGVGGKVGSELGPVVPDLEATLQARAQQMGLPPKQRIQPNVAPTPISVYQQAATPGEDLSSLYPRAERGQYPRGGRVEPLIDNQEAIAQGLAKRMESERGQNTQFFYHTTPVVSWAKRLGIPADKAEAWLNSFAKNYAAFSPRTETAQNIRNASLAMAKEKAGIPLTDVIGPGTGGISEKGYPMMIGGERGIHGQLHAAAISPKGIDRMSNPKPYFFSQNVAGNLKGVTVDTHAIRAVLDVQNELHPGSIEQWIKPQFKEAYKADPSKLDPATWIEDELAGISRKGKYAQVEYGPFADIYHRAADIMGVQPAEAQSMGWFASGKRTGLASERKTVLDLLNERINVTAKAMGWSERKAARLLFDRDISLLSGGAPVPMPANVNDARARTLQNLPVIMGNRS